MRTKWWLVAVSVLVVVAAVPVYRWVDEAGIVHYSDNAPPPVYESDAVQLAPAPPRREIEAARARLERLTAELETAREQSAAVQEQARIEQELTEAKRAERLRACKLAQQNLHTLGVQRPVYSIDERGERVFLDDRQRAGEVARLEKERDENCD